MIEVNDEEANVVVKIKVVGVGGAGNSAVNRMIDEGIAGVEFYAINTDKQALMNTKAKPVQIGEKTTHGFGAGADPSQGRAAAEESVDDIREALTGADMVFITCGMGGGTGTGAAPIVAHVAQELGSLVVAVVSKPFSYEADDRMQNALAGLEELKNNVDTLVVLPNDKILEIADRRMTKKECFRKADETLQQTVQNITEVINGFMDVNIDFSDVNTVMRNAGMAHVGVGFGTGDDRALEAVKEAVENKLMETTIDSAKKILLYISAGDLMIHDEEDISEYILAITGRQVKLITGSNDVDGDEMKDTCKVVLIATGIEEPIKHGAGRMVNPQAYRTPGVRTMGTVPQQTAPVVGMHTAPMPQLGQQPVAMPQQTTMAGTGPLPKMPAARTTGTASNSALGRTGSIFGGQPRTTAMDGTAPMRTPLAGQGTNNIPQFNHSTGASRLGGRRENNANYEIPKFIRSKKDKNED